MYLENYRGEEVKQKDRFNHRYRYWLMNNIANHKQMFALENWSVIKMNERRNQPRHHRDSYLNQINKHPQQQNTLNIIENERLILISIAYAGTMYKQIGEKKISLPSTRLHIGSELDICHCRRLTSTDRNRMENHSFCLLYNNVSKPDVMW